MGEFPPWTIERARSPGFSRWNAARFLMLRA